MPEQNPELLPCPCCGDAAWLHSYGGIFPSGAPGHRIEREGSCHAMTCYWHSESEAIAAWNTRPVSEVERLARAFFDKVTEIGPSKGKQE